MYGRPIFLFFFFKEKVINRNIHLDVLINLLKPQARKDSADFILQQDTTPHFHLLARGVGRDVTTHV